MNDEGRPQERPLADDIHPNVAQALVDVQPSQLATLLAAQPGTPLQRHVCHLRRAVFGARRELGAREREAYASISAQTLHRTFAPEFVLLEAEEAIRRAA